MTTTPAALWLLRLLPLLWFGLILTADVSTVTETARTLVNEKGLPPATDWVGLIAQNARSGIVAVGADSADSETALRLLSLLFPENWLLTRIDAAEALVLTFLIRIKLGLHLLGGTLFFWLTALYDGRACRRVAYRTFTPYRPILAMNAGSAAILLPLITLMILASPLLHAESIALITAVLASGAVHREKLVGNGIEVVLGNTNIENMCLHSIPRIVGPTCCS